MSSLLPISKTLPDLSKLEPLDGTNYKRWSQKLLIFFEQLEVDYCLFNELESKDKSSSSSSTTTTLTEAQKKAAEDAQLKHEKDNKLVRGHLLHHMSNTLFDLFVNMKSSKVIWDTLERKYGADDAGKKKYVVGKWINFKMTDDKPIMEQVHEYENLVTDILSEGMEMCETLQANVLLEKFPPSWNDYRNSLKHKKKDMSLQDLISHMRTEEANRLKDKFDLLSLNPTKANLVESSVVLNNKSRFNASNGKKENKKGKFTKTNGVHKPKGVCYVCGKPGHKAFQCYKRHGKFENFQKSGTKATSQANLIEKDEIIAAVVVEANLVENKTEWILDTGASRHFCSNKALMKDFEDAKDGDHVYLGNNSTAGVLGKGKVYLKLTSGKTLFLNDVLYVPSLRRNLVSGALLNKAGLKLVFEANKIVMTRNGDFVGKGYQSGGLFVLNIDEANESISLAYLVESLDTWHNRLGHLSFSSMKKLKSMNLISFRDVDEYVKCPICVEAKYSKKPFEQVVSRSTSLLELIHSDLANFKNCTSKGGKNYYITFVDDFSRYTKVYLLKSKDEAESAFLKYKAEVENQLDLKIKRLRSDRGGEYGTNSLTLFC